MKPQTNLIDAVVYWTLNYGTIAPESTLKQWRGVKLKRKHINFDVVRKGREADRQKNLRAW